MTDGEFRYPSGRVFHTTDGGRTWTVQLTGLVGTLTKLADRSMPSQPLRSLLVAPGRESATEGTLYPLGSG